MKKMNKPQLTYLLGSLLFFTVHVKAQELTGLIETAFKNNPQIQQFESKYKRIAEKKQQVQSLPNTQFGVGVFASTPETRTGAQKFKISAKQMFPFFGTITARENYASAMADVAYQDIVILKQQLITKVSQSYYKLYEIQAKQQVLASQIELLNTYEKLALTSVEVGKASAVSVLKLQIRQNELVQLQEVLVEKYIATQATLNKLLNRGASTTILVPMQLELPKKMQPIQVNNLQFHPELIKYDKLFTAVEKSEILNKKERNPMIGFGLDYVNVEKRPNLSFNDNGKDILMPMVSLSIPIFTKKHTSISKQNSFQKEEVVSQRQHRYNLLETKLQKAIANKNAAYISYHTQAKNLEQAKNAQEILIKSYETGTIDFNDVLDIQELQLKFQMNQIASTVSFYNQTVIINYLTTQK